MEIIRDLWLCVDCTIVACNGDYSGIESDDRIAKINAGFERLGAHVSANFDCNADEDTGIREFSSCGCDCCGSRLAGEFHRFAILGEPEQVPSDFAVRVLVTDEDKKAAKDLVTCGACGRSWDDAIPTTYTPAPSARCPFEAWHAENEE